MDVWPTRWGVFEVGPKMKSLKEWLDDDPRNPAFSDERRLKSISALLMKTAAKPAPPLPEVKDAVKDAVKDEGKDAIKDAIKDSGGWSRMATEPNAETAADAEAKKRKDGRGRWVLRRDGYAALDEAEDAVVSARASGDTRARARARDDAATALCSVIRFVLSGSTKFWAQSTQWLRACLNLCAALPDALGTGAGAPAPGGAAGDRLAVVVARVLPPEAMLRASGATAQEWLERREAWFTGLRGVEDFDLRVPPKALMSVEDAEAAVALAAAQAAEAIEWSTTDAALAGAAALSVARSARLLATLCSALSPDPERLTREQFLAATPPATHAATVTACAPGSVVALVRKGMKLTRERYLDTRVGFTPEGWIPLRELRPVERAVVRGVAYRAAVPAPPEWQGMGTPPCVWVLLELLDPAMIMPGRRKAGEAPAGGPRLVSAPVFAGGEIADYIIDWEKYSACLDRPWAKGARIQMLFEDLTAGADPTAYGALPPPPEPPKEAAPEKPGASAAPASDATASDAKAAFEGDVSAGASPGTLPTGPGSKETAFSGPETTTVTAVTEATTTKDDEKEKPKVGILKGANGAEYWLGRVSRVRGGDDPWENTQVLFDSDPDGEEPMGVCPREIELAPAAYQTSEDRAHDPFGKPGRRRRRRGGRGALRREPSQVRRRQGHRRAAGMAARLAFGARGVPDLARGGDAARRAAPRAPTFCHSELDLYVVLTNVLCDGGYELVTAEKNWKKIAKTLGKDLTTQTSASFALRTHYQRCLLDLENWLWANVDTLGPRPESFDDASDASARATRKTRRRAPRRARRRRRRDGRGRRERRGGGGRVCGLRRREVGG